VTRLAVNIAFLFPELPFLARVAAARDAGFAAIEFPWPTEPPDEVAAAIRRAAVEVALINVAAGDLAAGERGYPNDPQMRDRWRADFDAAMRLAGEVACPTLNVLAGNRLAGVTMIAQLDCLRANLDWALPRAANAGRTLTLELLNPIDTPRYLLTDPARIRALIEAVDSPGLRLQFDTYQFGRVVPDVTAEFRRFAPLVGHIQVGDIPERHEPGTGTIDFRAFLDAVAEAGYDRAIGLEYVPAGGTLEGLGWVERYGLDRRASTVTAVRSEPSSPTLPGNTTRTRPG
jgi:hydroxypyruvate isomerase